MMSALGQKRTSERFQSMSALPPKADIGTQSWNVRFVPKADIWHCNKFTRIFFVWNRFWIPAEAHFQPRSLDRPVRQPTCKEGRVSLPRWLRREGRAAEAHASARILPQLFSFVQLPDGAGDSDEIVFRESLSNIGVVHRRLADRDRDLIGKRGDRRLVA